MRLGCIFAGMAVCLMAQEPAPAPSGIIRGQILEWDGEADSGTLVVRSDSSSIYRLRFDSRTYFEWRERQVSVSEARQGDPVEIVSDRAGNAPGYARIVRILETPRPKRYATSRNPLRYRSPTEHFAPRGNLTFSGVIVKFDTRQLVLRTWNREDKLLLLRNDTRYLGDGLAASHDALSVNSRVFIRAGKNFEGDVEAYQIVWGQILRPDLPSLQKVD
jgi:hypothetical protein